MHIFPSIIIIASSTLLAHKQPGICPRSMSKADAVLKQSALMGSVFLRTVSRCHITTFLQPPHVTEVSKTLLAVHQETCHQ